MQLSLTLAVVAVYWQSSFAYEDFINAVKNQFTPAAQKEFHVVVGLANQNPGEVFRYCDNPVRPRSRCYGSHSQDFVENARENLKGICVQPTIGILDMINGIATKFGEPERNEIIARKSIECGATCTRRLGCCRQSSGNFYFQGSNIGYCTRRACKIKSLTVEEQQTLEVHHECDLARAGFPDWDTVGYMSRLILPEMQEVHKRLMCNIFGTEQPRMNCERGARNGTCVCCCHNQRPLNGICVRTPSLECQPQKPKPEIIEPTENRKAAAAVAA